MKVKDVGESRIALMSVVYSVMSISDRTLRRWNKVAAPSKVDRESILIDTLIAKGWRLIDFSSEEGKE